MACRIRNLGRNPLRIDLRGGEVLYVKEGETTLPLREELLYDNVYLREWERKGLIARLPAKMSEVLEQEKQQKEEAGGKARPALKPPVAAVKAEDKDRPEEANDLKEKDEKKNVRGGQ